MKVPLLDLKAQHASIRDAVFAAVHDVLDSQICIGGPHVAELERRVAALSECAHGVAMSSGTDALLCALMALGIKTGDEVITTPFTFFATAGCVARTGARPVFVDIDPDTFNIDAQRIEAAITPRTRAIMPVHLYGQMCDMDPIMDVARRHKLAVIEDAAQSISATYRGRKAGSIGDIGCFSFFPSKNLGAAGDGGMCVTQNAELAAHMARLRNHGMEPKYYHHEVGANFRLDAMQAAVLNVKLAHLDAWSAARRRNAAYYDARFAGTAVKTPVIRDTCVSIYNQYVVRVPNRDAVIARLKAAEIGHEIYYPVALHQQQCFEYLGYNAGAFPEAERAASEVLALPIYPELTEEMLDAVVTTVLKA